MFRKVFACLAFTAAGLGAVWASADELVGFGRTGGLANPLAPAHFVGGEYKMESCVGAESQPLTQVDSLKLEVDGQKVTGRYLTTQEHKENKSTFSGEWTGGTTAILNLTQVDEATSYHCYYVLQSIGEGTLQGTWVDNHGNRGPVKITLVKEPAKTVSGIPQTTFGGGVFKVESVIGSENDPPIEVSTLKLEVDGQKVTGHYLKTQAPQENKSTILGEWSGGSTAILNLTQIDEATSYHVCYALQSIDKDVLKGTWVDNHGKRAHVKFILVK